MPNYDAGHYFLTVFAPIRLDSMQINGQSHSRRHLIREVLADMPVAESTGVSQGTNPDNPFARNTRTHFARFVVLDDVVFNGRVSGDTLIDLVRGVDPMTPQIADRLSSPFLIFACDFDAAGDGDDELRRYLADLWTTMGAELKAIFTHCVGFNAVGTADEFFRYIKKCQVETTMPFNDYWSTPLNVPDLDFKPYIYGAIGVAAVALLAWMWAGFGTGVLVLLAGLAIDLLVIYCTIMMRGRLPFPKSPPPAPSSDLPTILKALYLQRAFTNLAIRSQSLDDQALQKAFGAFIDTHDPENIKGPTQKPGVIGV